MAAIAQTVMLAQKWSESVDPTNWWMSEKLDGVRAYWSGSNFYSRQGNQFFAPKWFTKDLPKEPLDGELWCGRGLFQKTLSIIKKSKDWEKHADQWKYVTYLVFDAPDRSKAGEKYEERVKWMEENIEPKKETTYAAVVGVCKCTGMAHLQKMLKQVLMKGGEGIMLRKPRSLYEHCRSHTLLKVKFFHDEEAKVTGHDKGTGRCANMMGKINCVLPNGVTFKIGSGFSDAQRRNPPKIGSVVTFKYQEMSDNGHPRFPVFLRERADMTWADVLKNAATKAPFSSLKKKAIPLLQKQHSILFSTIPSRDQESGKKVVTQNDADDDLEDEAENLLTTKQLPAAAAATSSKKRGGKRMCQWGSSCYRKNQDHLDKFDHPTRAEEEAAAGGDDEEKEEVQQPKKRAKTDSVTSPSAAGDGGRTTDSVTSPSAAGDGGRTTASTVAASSSTTTKSKKECYYGTDCYNKDPDHLKRFTHPEKVVPKTKEEFIATTNQSQHDLAEYYQFGGDPEEDEVEIFLAEDKNERQMSIQRFNENKPNHDLAEVEMEMDEVRTVVATKKMSFFQACASDEEDDDGEMQQTVAVADLPAPRQKSGQGKKLPRANSTDATVVVPKVTRASSRGTPTAVAAAAGNGSTKTSSTATTTKSCVFIIPELLAKAALTIESEEGEVICKKCKKEVGEHREAR